MESHRLPPKSSHWLEKTKGAPRSFNRMGGKARGFWGEDKRRRGDEEEEGHSKLGAG
jgi:hypothetical protein